MNNFQQQKIAVVIINTLLKRLNLFQCDFNSENPFRKSFCQNFHSKQNIFFNLTDNNLQTFFEKVAHILSDGEKREYTSKKLGNLKIYQSQKNQINVIMTELSNSERKPNLEQENDEIFSINSGNLTNAIDFSADVFIEDNNSITAIELKSVKPNSGEMKGEKQKILEGKTALKKAFPNKEVYFYMGFPFDPTSNTKSGYNKTRFLGSIINMTKFFDPAETLIASELWDKLSGETETMEQILEIINTISTPDFMEKFQFLQNNSNRNNPQYQQILAKWFLFSEIELLEKDSQVKEIIQTDKKLQKIYHQQIFKGDEYNWQRASELSKI